ncbi:MULTISPECIES: dihydrofolate reductase family protein [unclassified Streptomyces]|uniref:dihydrofolate reductase family protein n=1 Tax=unclassified Streptomyces TaxID=2593676 RepID=UPI000CD4E557|nr:MULTISPECIES: dihydrofolate reductase family protein [unclassified Streptomyces]
MTAVLVHATTSLDGFIAGPDDDMSWAFAHAGAENPVAEEVMRTTGAFLSGRRSYDIGRRESEEPFGGAFTGAQLVLSHRPPPVDDPLVEFVSLTVPEAVALGRERAADGNLLVTGGQVARQVLRAGLVDEVVLHIVPVVLGSGVPLLDASVTDHVRLRPHHVSRSGDVLNVRYAVEPRTAEASTGTA